MNRKPLLGMIFLVVLVLSWASCGSKVAGTYSDTNGGIMLELKSGGQATFTFAGEVTPCTYKVDGNKLMLECKGDKKVFTIHDDGSLTGPPGSFMGALRKTKA
jgi:hypothetical protein